MEKSNSKDIQITVETSIFQRRERIITIKLKTPKGYFEIGEFLSQFGKFESVEGFFETLVRNGADVYLENAQAAIGKIEKAA